MDLSESVEKRLKVWLSPGARVLCAVSGGPDSVALAHAMKSLPYPVTLGHVDHQLRKNSGQDAVFVRSLADKWDLPFKVRRVRVLFSAAARKTGLEETARDLRYQALAAMARESRCTVIVTAHTADDQAETILMNFLRGTGPSGLAGIPPVRRLQPGLQLVRPMLDGTRADVLDYLRTHRLASRNDPSNRSPRFTRNRIRHRVLPALERDYPGLRKRLVHLAEIFRDEQDLWAGKIEQEFIKTVRQNSKKITVDLARLLGYHRALGRRILRQILTGISFQDTERIFQLAHSRDGHPNLQLPGGLRVVRHNKVLVIQRGNV